MKKVLILLFVLSITGAIFSACEKDDICPAATQTTPLLVVGFYDNVERDVLKAVPNLRVIGEGMQTPVTGVPDRGNPTTIELPLKSLENSSAFQFIINSADDENDNETGNVDIIRFTYEPQEIFISRGCGYSVNYNNLDAITNPGEDDTNEWITGTSVPIRNIVNQDTVHVKIFH